MPTTTAELFGVDVKHKRDLVAKLDGDIDIISGKDNAIEAIFRRVFTTKGSIIHRPDYGVGLPNFQNIENRIDQRLKITEDIRVQMGRDDRVQEVKEVSFIDDVDNPAQFKIRIRANLVGLPDLTLEEAFIV